MKVKYTESRWYQETRMSVTKHRNRKGCDGCKIDTSTEAFIGFCGNVLWLCNPCFKELISKFVKLNKDVQK